MVENWYSMLRNSLETLLENFVQVIPDLLGAIVIFIIGWFISIGMGKLVAGILKRLKFNQIFEKGGMKGALEKAEIKVNASDFIGAIFKWIFVTVFLLVSVDILGLSEFAGLLREVLGYIPNVVVAVLIFVVTVVVVDIVEKLVRVAVEGVKVGSGHLVSMIVKYSIWIFAILIILHQLEVAQSFIETLFSGIIGLMVISFGLAFGLGGKEVAGDILVDLKKKIKGED